MTKLQTHRFSAPRKEVDRCLVREITDLFASMGHTNPQRWLESVDALSTLRNSPSHLQRFLINRHWRVVLGLQDRSTEAERYHLFDDGDDVDVWLKVFANNVAPTIVMLGL